MSVEKREVRENHRKTGQQRRREEEGETVRNEMMDSVHL